MRGSGVGWFPGEGGGARRPASSDTRCLAGADPRWVGRVGSAVTPKAAPSTAARSTVPPVVCRRGEAAGFRDHQCHGGRDNRRGLTAAALCRQGLVDSISGESPGDVCRAAKSGCTCHNGSAPRRRWRLRTPRRTLRCSEGHERSPPVTGVTAAIVSQTVPNQPLHRPPVVNFSDGDDLARRRAMQDVL